VNTSADMDKAVDLAHGIQGVRSVKNDMRVKSQ
jgi:osmotically-inducible protein OsmY